jgi:chemotaxis protein MotA
MGAERRRRLDVASLVGLPLAALVVLLGQTLEGGSARSLWQPTAALIVFGGTCAAVLVSFPVEVTGKALTAVFDSFFRPDESIEPTIKRIVGFVTESRRRGVVALEHEIDGTADPFLRVALTLAVDGTNPKTTRQILDIESEAYRTAAESPADVFETAAGYTPTLGILGAVLGLIHVMESLSEPAKLGSGIAVAFVATVYGVAAANLVLLPLATKLRVRARGTALHRAIIIEGILALQEGLNPRLVEQKLRGHLTPSRATRRRVA